jgi:hypothetical protein
MQRLALRERFEQVRGGLVDGDGLCAGPGGSKGGKGKASGKNRRARDKASCKRKENRSAFMEL